MNLSGSSSDTFPEFPEFPENAIFHQVRRVGMIRDDPGRPGTIPDSVKKFYLNDIKDFYKYKRA